MTNARTIADSAGEATVLDVTAGTAAASKAVVLDASKNIATLGTVASGALTATTVTTTGNAIIGGDLTIDDDSQISLGASADLVIRHNAANGNSFIQDTGTGGLTIQANSTLSLQSYGSSENFLVGTSDAGVKLYHNGNEKIETTSTGIDITGAFTATAASTITTADNTNTLSLVSTDADASVGPNLVLYRNSGSPAVDDHLGKIAFQGENDADQVLEYFSIRTYISDETDGTEDGHMQIVGVTNGADKKRLDLTPTEAVFNDDSLDIDFRVESNDNATMLKVDAGNNKVGIGTASPAYTAQVSASVNDVVFGVENTATSGNVFGEQIVFSSTVNDTGSYFFRCVGNNQSTVRAVIFANGDFDSATNSYGATSDERIKQNITDANSQWNDIKALKVRNFKLKDEARTETSGGQAAKTYLGLVAQEAETVSPGLVKSRNPEKADILSSSEFGTLYEDGDDIPEGKAIGDIKTTTNEKVKSVSYSVLYMKAIKALQEAMAKIETLETKVAALEG